MNDILRMEILYTQSNMNKYLPYDIVYERTAFLLLFIDVVIQIAQLAVFYNYIYLLVIDETIEVANNIRGF